jgi:hypothetical protein
VMLQFTGERLAAARPWLDIEAPHCVLKAI